MRPGARLWAAIEILDLIDGDQRPAERVLRDYFRTRRYAGSGDRRRVGETVFQVSRNRGALDWRLGEVGLGQSNLHRTLLTQDGDSLSCLIADAHFLDKPDAATLAALDAAASADLARAPLEARLNLPAWLIGEVGLDSNAEVLGTSPRTESVDGAAATTHSSLGLVPGVSESLEALSAALSGRAATDLRANTLQTDRDILREALAKDGIDTEPLDIAPHALRLKQPARLEDHPLYRAGHFEVQDAGSQMVGHLVGARPGERVADICAGAGGKTLLLAADMANQGTLFATDIDARRLGRLQMRARRAGAANITIGEPGNEAVPAAWRGSMDRVLVDAPCSGSGTWRRQPEQRWRLTPVRLKALQALQAELLDRAVGLLRPGGRLTYITCSFLGVENETAITELTGRYPGLETVPWREAAPHLGDSAASPGDRASPWLRIGPHEHGVDSFFAAVLRKPLG